MVHRSSTNGCGFLMLTCLVTCIFFLFNVALTVSVFGWSAGRFPVLREVKTTQTIMYLGPVLLLFLEWWLVDVLVDRLFRDGERPA